MREKTKTTEQTERSAGGDCLQAFEWNIVPRESRLEKPLKRED